MAPRLRSRRRRRHRSRRSPRGSARRCHRRRAARYRRRAGRLRHLRRIGVDRDDSGGADGAKDLHAMWPRPPSPITTATAPASSRFRTVLIACIGVTPASASGATRVGSSGGNGPPSRGTTWRASATMYSAIVPSGPSPGVVGNIHRVPLVWHALDRPPTRWRQCPHARHEVDDRRLALGQSRHAGTEGVDVAGALVAECDAVKRRPGRADRHDRDIGMADPGSAIRTAPGPDRARERVRRAVRAGWRRPASGRASQSRVYDVVGRVGVFGADPLLCRTCRPRSWAPR